MAIVGALSIGRSGLLNSSTALSVIGNNIANVTTVGFKGSRTEFADLLSADAGAQVGKVGLGSRVGAIRTLFGQGSVENTGRPLDVAIDGDGFFVLRENTGQVYTRAGNFKLQPDGTVTNLIGDALQGTPLDATGNVIGGLQDITVSNIGLQPTPSQNVGLNGNLRADLPAQAFPAGTPTFQQAYTGASYGTSVQVYDSLGKAHELTLLFNKTSTAGQWEVRVGVDAGDVGGTPGNLQLLGGPTNVTFNPDGTFNTGAVTRAVTFNGAAAQNITVDLANMTQLAADSGIGTVTQDGFGVGGLSSLSVDDKGIVHAVFDNGQTRPLFQLAIANFNAPEGLAASGNGIYRATVDSGQAAIGTAQTEGNGSIVASALEQSNVELAQQFIDLIGAQRSFQANARVISTSDALLNELVNIAR